MEYRPLGRTGVQVSRLCFGTMSFGGDAERDESERMYRACRDRGVNFFDCADAYSEGRAEEILGELMAHERDELVVTSKCFVPTGPDINARGGSRRHITRAVEASLTRLGTDRLDVLFMHRFDPITPLEETLRGLEDLVRAGKVLYLGATILLQTPTDYRVMSPQQFHRHRIAELRRHLGRPDHVREHDGAKR